MKTGCVSVHPMRHIANLFVHFGAAVPPTGEHEKGCPEAGNAWHCGKGRRGSAEPIDQPRQEAQGSIHLVRDCSERLVVDDDGGESGDQRGVPHVDDGRLRQSDLIEQEHLVGVLYLEQYRAVFGFIQRQRPSVSGRSEGSNTVPIRRRRCRRTG